MPRTLAKQVLEVLADTPTMDFSVMEINDALGREESHARVNAVRNACATLLRRGWIDRRQGWGSKGPVWYYRIRGVA